MSTLSTPTAEQLAGARLAHWHQSAEPILTLNMLRDWLNTAGLVLFTPRAAQLPAPAPSVVEALLGVPKAAPAPADVEPTRSLMTRLVLDGGAIPLNLLGSPTGMGTETPDFLVSPLALPYLFTLRGDKAWKQPPATNGATKVSPLALNAYTLLAERVKDNTGGMSAYDLTAQLGKEVTEAAVLRALTELWQHLRVLPVPQLDGAATLWELTAARFTKQIKAGANAGQPTALSALISLYLGQAVVASEEEIETFLSPVASRSRIRDVIHALLSARQLETIAVEGRTVLHVAGELPVFLSGVPAAEAADLIAVPEREGKEAEGETPRITKFVAKPRKAGTGFVSKPRQDVAGSNATRERRPFTRESNRPDRPSFTKPWAEERAGRASQRPFQVQEGSETGPSAFAAREYKRENRTSSIDREEKRPFSSKPSFGGRAGFGGKSRSESGGRPAFGGDRPSFRRDQDGAATPPPRREFSPRSEGSSGSEIPRKTFSKPGTFGRKRDNSSGRPAFSRDNVSRSSGREFSAGSSGDRRRAAEDRPRRSFADRPERSDSNAAHRPGSYAAHPDARGRGVGSGAGSRSGGFAPRKPRPAGEGTSGFAGKPSFGRGGQSGERGGRFGAERGGTGAGGSSGPVYRKFDAPRTPRSPSTGRAEGGDRPGRPEGGYAGKSSGSPGARKPYGGSEGGFPGKGGFGAKSGGTFGGKKPYGKSASAGTGKPASTFDKFKGNKKPFGNRAPARKFKRKETE